MEDHKIFMIVDDDSDDRFFFCRAIEKISPLYACIEAQQGEDALWQLKNLADLPNYIFLDLNMPLMDGKRCLAEIKKDDKLRNIPVIIYSTSSSAEDIRITEKLGAAYYLVKPQNISILPESIKNAINTVEGQIYLSMDHLPE
ncbi:MAG: response regulator [Chryseolinea sp.]